MKYINSYQKLINIKCGEISTVYLRWMSLGVRGQGLGVRSWRDELELESGGGDLL